MNAVAKINAGIVPAALFDYKSLPADAACVAREAAHEIRESLRRCAADVGAKLLEAKAVLPFGEFGKWLNTEFQMKPRTAENYMNAYRLVAGKNANFALLPQSAVFMLAAPSAPKEVVAEIIQEVEAGTILKVHEVKERLAVAAEAFRQAAPPAKLPAERVKARGEVGVDSRQETTIEPGAPASERVPDLDRREADLMAREAAVAAREMAFDADTSAFTNEDGWRRRLFAVWRRGNPKWRNKAEALFPAW